MIKSINAILKTNPIILKFFDDSEQLTFTDFQTLEEFILKENQEFSYIDNNSLNLTKFKNYLINFKSALNSVKITKIAVSPQSTANFFRQIRQSATNYVDSKSIRSLSIHSAKIKELIELNKTYIANAYYNIVVGHHYNMNNRNDALAFIEYSVIVNSGFGEKAVQTQRNIAKSLQNGYSKKLSDLNEKYSELVAENESWNLKKLEELNNLTKKNNETFEKLLTDTRAKMLTLEQAYNEKLKLQAPAQEWEKQEKSYFKNFVIFILIATVISIAFLIFLGYMLNSKDILDGDFDLLNYNTIKGSLIFTMMISVGVYMINIFIKLSMSSLHLSRDAKERKQLAYFYLALTKDNLVDSTDRHIIMQSLFSRSDSGLFKGDSTPSMPTDSILNHTSLNR